LQKSNLKFPARLLFKIIEEAIPFSKFAPDEFRKTFLSFSAKIVSRSFAVVVFPFVPVTKIILVWDFLKDLINKIRI